MQHLPDDVPSRAVIPATHSPSPAIGCGGVALSSPPFSSIPVSSGPLAGVARLMVRIPATAQAGASVPVSTVVVAATSLPRVIAVPATSALLIVRDGNVVGYARGESTYAVPLQPGGGTAQPVQVVPDAVRLAESSSCTGSTRAPGSELSPGRYLAVAVLGYRLDPLYGAPADGGVPRPPVRDFALVSAPEPITIT